MNTLHLSRITGWFQYARIIFHLSILSVLIFTLLFSTNNTLAAGGQLPGAPGASATIDQCRNGTFASPANCDDSGGGNSGWVNGNANATQSHWSEGQSLPERIKITGLSAGSHSLRFTYDYTTTSGGEHAFDYLTTYNRSYPADVCGSFLSPCPSPSTFPIPPDPVLPTCDSPQHSAGTGGIPEVPGDFTIYNGTITGAAYVPPLHTCHGVSKAVTMVITFTSTTLNVAIAFGAHIAGEFDWGNGQSAHAINGSPYHIYLNSLDGASTGSQDNQLMAAAVYSTDIATSVSATNLTAYSPVHDTASINGMFGSNVSTTPPIAGMLNFYLCADNTIPFGPPDPNGCDHSDLNAVLLTSTPITVNGNGSYDSPTYTPSKNGYYCFRAEFTPDINSPYPFARESNALTTGGAAECFLVQNPNAVHLTSLRAVGDAHPNPLVLAAAAALLLSLGALALRLRSMSR